MLHGLIKTMRCRLKTRFSFISSSLLFAFVCGVVWCGAVWCGVVWCGVLWCCVGRWEREGRRGVGGEGGGYASNTLPWYIQNVPVCSGTTRPHARNHMLRRRGRPSVSGRGLLSPKYYHNENNTKKRRDLHMVADHSPDTKISWLALNRGEPPQHVVNIRVTHLSNTKATEMVLTTCRTKLREQRPNSKFEPCISRVLSLPFFLIFRV